MKAMIFIFVRELIKKILREETEKKKKDLSPTIKELLDVVVKEYKGTICSVDVIAPWKRGPIGTHSDFKDYQVRVNVIGGLGSKRWPQTQAVYKERDKIVNDVWHTVYNFMGLSTDVFLRNVKSCDEVLTESSNERLEKLIDNYISMSYPTAKKIKLAPPGVNGSITTFTLPDPEDERDNLIFKFDVFGKPEYNINPEFFNSISSMFGTKRNIKKLILKWFEEKEVDVDLMQDSKKEKPIEEGLHDTSWENDEGDKVTLIDLLDATEDIPVKNIPVDKIKSKLLTWDDDDKEVDKIEKADLEYPILIFVDDNNKFISIIDGHHRAQKAVRHKLKTIKAKIIPINSLPKNFKKVFGHLGKQEQNESELTERCWKGYTQKGMKTMFGKRYPNCVKIKKKRVNESNVIDYLKKFVGYKATDQKYQFQKIVDIITKITKRDNPIEGLAGVAVTHVKKDMWGQTFTDPKSVGMRWDFKVILRPLFTEFNPNKEEDYSQKVLKFELDFLENAHGMGLGITSPIEHENVKDYKVTFEWTSPLRLEKI